MPRPSNLNDSLYHPTVGVVAMLIGDAVRFMELMKDKRALDYAYERIRSRMIFATPGARGQPSTGSTGSKAIKGRTNGHKILLDCLL
jgi:hypothetical protein